jgi:predicted ATPase
VPKGVYLWGTVGGGKTMLMDLFYDTLEGKKELLLTRGTSVHVSLFLRIGIVYYRTYYSAE